MSPVPTISRARPGTFLLLIALAAGIGHRLYLAVATDFPINDGALSYAFIKKGDRRKLPFVATVSFNDLAIRFTYPPLSFWLGALLNRLGTDALGVVHLLPILSNAP
jgi:hypothetical protein